MSIAALLFFIRRLSLTVPLWIVAGWSAAEAVIFFIVADVPISWIAVRKGMKAAVLAALVAAVASIIGAIAAWVWAKHDPAGQAAVYASLPGISPELIGEAADRYRHGIHAVIAGSFGGIPFKLFAADAAKAGDWWFAALAPLMRLPRFFLVAVGVGLISKLLERWMQERAQLSLLVLCWVAFYAWYWTVMAR